MLRKIAFLVVATALVGTAASAGERSKNRSSQSNDTNKLICKTLEESGQKLKRTRACHTAAEWRELQRQARAQIERIQNSRAY